ncbi:hypothetical protein ABE29_14355 [Cytobacillus firmus]|nr:hypothetical protein [Cytobacillus firmus]MBG9551260.1 hypothetical protein [Cytobacillus firmus]MBG9557524.1 hypothetical protein [Cytobacillus firmus]
MIILQKIQSFIISAPNQISFSQFYHIRQKTKKQKGKDYCIVLLIKLKGRIRLESCLREGEASIGTFLFQVNSL